VLLFWGWGLSCCSWNMISWSCCLVVVGEDDSFFPSVGGEIPVFDFHLGGEGGTGIVLVIAGGKVVGVLTMMGPVGCRSGIGGDFLVSVFLRVGDGQSSEPGGFMAATNARASRPTSGLGEAWGGLVMGGSLCWVIDFTSWGLVSVVGDV
jgi:hypothetical protein